MTGSTRVQGPFEVHGLIAAVVRTACPGANLTLDIDRLLEVEAFVATRFGDDLLALFAARLPALVDGYQFELSRVVGHTGALRDAGIRGDLIGVGRVKNGDYLCVDKHARAQQVTQLHRLEAHAPQARKSRSVALCDWLISILELEPADVEAPLCMQLVRKPTESTLAGRPVHHKIFGNGVALSEAGKGPTRKVKVDFPGHGLKTLQARFLTFQE